jgi:uncharacterized membrane protein
MGTYQVLKGSFKTGLVMLLPFLVSVIVVKFLADQLFLLVNPLVRQTNLAAYTGNIEIVAQFIAVLLVVATITVAGYISSYRASERLSRKLESVIEEIPVFGSVYSAVNQISESFSSDSKFEKMVLVEMPFEEVYSIGLVTSEAPDPVKKGVGDSYQSVYLPYSPNPTMGRLRMVKEDNLHEVDMTVSEGMKLLLTTGITYESEEIEKEFGEKLTEELQDLGDRIK